eukprot:g17401.t1
MSRVGPEQLPSEGWMSAPTAVPQGTGDAEALPFTPGVLQASTKPLADPAAILKVGCAIVVGCAQALEAANGEESPWAEEQSRKGSKGKGKSKGKDGKGKDGHAPRRPRRLPGHHFATLSAICQAEKERQGEAPEEADDDLEESLGLQAGVFPGGRQKAQSRFAQGGRAPRPSHNMMARPTPPSAGCLKALPSQNVQDFLNAVQDVIGGVVNQTFDSEIRNTAGMRRSKEGFGGMRAMLHYFLESCATANQVAQALGFLDELKASSEARLVSSAAFNALLRGLLSRNGFEEAQWLRTEMLRFGVAPNEASLNLLMDTAARSGSHMDEAWDILEASSRCLEMQKQNLKADKYTVSILTKQLSDRISDKRRVPRGVAMVEHFLKMQPEDVDEVLVNSLLDVFCKLGDMPRLEATLDRMREYGIRGSAVTYGTIVKAYGRAGNIDRVLQAWEEMQDEGLEANAVTYGCMLDACVKCGHLEKALQIFAIMKQRGLHRNTILYATLIKGFAKSKDPLAAKNLYREMRSERVPCNVVVFNSLIDACVRACDLQGAAEVLQEMTATNVRPDLITFSTLIKGYCSNGELSKAMRLQEELQARQLECDEIVYNSLLEGCVKAGDLQLGLRMFSEMRQKHVRPSAVTFSILVKLLSRAGRLDLAIHLVSKDWEQGELLNGSVDLQTYQKQFHKKEQDAESKLLHPNAPDAWRAANQDGLVMPSDLLSQGSRSQQSGDGFRVAGQRWSLLGDRPANEENADVIGRISMYSAVIESSTTSGEVSTALQLIEWAYTRAPPEDARAGLSMDLLKRVFETAGFRGAEGEAQDVLDAIGRRVGEHARNVLQDTLSRSASGPRVEESLGFKGGSSLDDHGSSWSSRPWDRSYSSGFEDRPARPTRAAHARESSGGWETGGYWPGQDMYSSLFMHPHTWSPDVLAQQGWSSWSGQGPGGWDHRDEKAFARSGGTETILLKAVVLPLKALDTEPTPATTAGKSSVHRSPLEDGPLVLQNSWVTLCFEQTLILLVYEDDFFLP